MTTATKTKQPPLSSSSPYNPHIASTLIRNQHEISNLRNTIESIRTSQQALKTHQQTRMTNKKSHTQHSNWRDAFTGVKLPSHGLRSSDKSYEVRAFTNLDLNYWEGGVRGEGVRGWFNKNAIGGNSGMTAFPSLVAVDMISTGYLTASNNLGRGKSDRSEMREEVKDKMVYTIPNRAAGEYFSMALTEEKIFVSSL